MPLFYARMHARTLRSLRRASRVGHPSAGAFKAKLFHQSKRKCTDVYVVSENGEPVHGRSMEFGINVGRLMSVHPPGHRYNFKSPFIKKDFSGLERHNEFGYFAMNATLSPSLGTENLDLVSLSVDGVNETGLSVGALYLPGYAEFGVVSDHNEANNCILNVHMVDYLLGNFQSTADVVEDLQTKHVWDLSQLRTQLNGKTVATIHFVVYDSRGKGIVLEWVNGQLQIHDSIGVFTNSPPYPFHVLNSKQYIDALSPVNPETVDYGQGFGLFGLPGDWTPPSRFVRAAVQRQLMTHKSNAAETVNSMAHVMNTVDIMKGVALEEKKHFIRKDDFVADYTQWVVIKDLANNRMFYRFYDSLNWGIVEMDFEKLKDKVDKHPYHISLPENNPENSLSPATIPRIPKQDVISREQLVELLTVTI